MFDIGWTEMLVVAIVAILFVGPRELPGMLRTVGKSVKSLRKMAGDFQRQFDDALREAELDSVKDTLNDVKKLNPTSAIKDKLNPLKSEIDDVKKSVEKATELDPSTLFDESKAPEVDEPVKIDVEAALERQRKLDTAAKVPPSSGVNAVPGFGGKPGETRQTAAEPSSELPKTSAPASSKKSASKSKQAGTGKSTTASKSSGARGSARKSGPSASKKAAGTEAKSASTTSNAAAGKKAPVKRRSSGKAKA